jgi:hypothetical protein
MRVREIEQYDHQGELKETAVVSLLVAFGSEDGGVLNRQFRGHLNPIKYPCRLLHEPAPQILPGWVKVVGCSANTMMSSVMLFLWLCSSTAR